MSEDIEKILTEALELPQTERAELVDQLLSSFELPSRKKIDDLWTKEAEDRIDAYERGEIISTSAKNVFDKISRK